MVLRSWKISFNARKLLCLIKLCNLRIQLYNNSDFKVYMDFLSNFLEHI